MTERVLTVIGDATDVNAWSNIPYFFLEAGKRAGFFTRGLKLHPERLRRQRLLWNLGQLLRGRRPGGFQYSPEFLNALLAQDPPASDAEVVSHFPLLPFELGRWSTSYYLDATLQQNLDDYGIRRIVSAKVARDIVSRERDHLHAARFVVCMSPWAAGSARDFYGVPEERVHVILPGANIDEAVLRADRTVSPTSLNPIRLAFVGKHWQRKGLLRLLDAADRLSKRGLEAEIHVIGHSQEALPPHRAIRAHGFIDKRNEMPRFVSLLRSFHFGCLVSSAEALGISTLEALRCGVPAIGTNVGGIPGTIPEGAGFYVSLERCAEELADRLEALIRDPARYEAMRARAAEVAPHMTWDRTVADFSRLYSATDSTQRGGSPPSSNHR